jgi:ferritin-like metal-binding protein YciE
MKMKPYYLLILMIATTILVLPACDQKQTGTEKAMNKVDDALDRRSGEKARDAAEDASDKLEDAGKEIKESVKDATN